MTDARDGPLGIRKHQCEHCPKSFKRREHWQRHSRSHTNEKPFECRFCQKCFARRDLVTRHEKTLHANDASPGRSPTSVRRPSVVATRNGTSPIRLSPRAQDVGSPMGEERWDGISSLATTTSLTLPSTKGNDSLDHYSASTVGEFEDFLDPALRTHSDGGGLWDWTASQQLPQDADAYGESQAAEAPTAVINNASTLSHADKTSTTSARMP
ncbi:hypothetical protein DOTSEDRAFT_73932 [Dothistroma septosporum NZE10]|uniref:C2H2-type domain-containing protein n=1 Tax=Dothistroma septosporum (strain NZE10 / CBS 128990) TaxID=675120 RepID=N1PHW8_DOTSN|nr:hypothetical protein DOTSEDRAFT_73932 [Dothistroma septosporum NZE10]